MAQAGGKDASKLQAALQVLKDLYRNSYNYFSARQELFKPIENLSHV